MASKSAGMSDRARKIMMEIAAVEKQSETTENNRTFSGVMRFLGWLLFAITIAGVLANK